MTARDLYEDFTGRAADESFELEVPPIRGLKLPARMALLGRAVSLTYRTEAKHEDQDELGDELVDYKHTFETPVYVLGATDEDGGDQGIVLLTGPELEITEDGIEG